MSEMIERIVPILRDCYGENFEVTARKILEALRLPTEAMVTAGDKADYFCSEGIRISELIDRDGVANVFTAMIDAALNNGEM